MNRFVSLAAAASLALAGCAQVKAVLPLAGLGSSSSSEDSNPDLAAQVGAVEPMPDDVIYVVEPAPGHERAHPVKPTWCKPEDLGGRPRAFAAVVQRFIEGPDAAVDGAARRACMNPDDPGFQKQLGYLVQYWINVTHLGAADAFASLTARVDVDGWNAAQKAHCKRFAKKAEESPNDIMIRNAYATFFGCPTDTRYDGLDWYLDATGAAPSEVLRAQYLLDHLPKAPGTFDLADPYAGDGLGRYLSYSYDAVRFDAGKLLQQIQTAKWNAYGAWIAKEKLADVQHRRAAWKRILDGVIAEEKLYGELPAAMARAWTDWDGTYQARKAIFDEVIAFERSAADVGGDGFKGCGEKLRPHLAAILTAARPKTLAEAKAALTGPVAAPLVRALGACEILEGRSIQGATLLGAAADGVSRGPRAAGQIALRVAVERIVQKRKTFPIKPDAIATPPGGNWMDDLVEEELKKTDWKATEPVKAEVASVKKIDGGVSVQFRKRIDRRQDYDCQPTGRIEAVATNGTIQWEQDCKKAGILKVDLTPKPIFVQTPFAARVAPGMVLEVKSSLLGGVLPTGEHEAGLQAVYDKKGKLIAAYGVEL